MDTSNLSASQVATLLEIMAMVDLPRDGEVITDKHSEGILRVTVAQAGTPCGIPCKNGLFAKTFTLALYDGVCWLCKQNEINSNETLITPWGAGWVSFSCFCKHALEHTTAEIVGFQSLTKEYDSIFSNWEEYKQAVSEFLTRNISAGDRASILGRPAHRVRSAIGRSLSDMLDLNTFVTSIKGRLL